METDYNKDLIEDFHVEFNEAYCQLESLPLQIPLKQ